MHYHVTIGVTTTWYHRATTENHSRRTFHPPNHKPMNLSPDQILALAPDPASANAGKKLANAKSWQSLGQSTDALWGECQGSALYQVRVDLRDTTVKCSCPSRKFPCKHGLGLLLLTSASPAAVPRATPPAWVDEWLARRAGAQAKREEKTNAGQPAAVADDPSTTEKRKVQAEKSAAKRARQVAKGLDALDLWLDDLIRTGLAGLELKPASFWEAQAARMVDAQAPGIATRLRALAAIPNATPEWPERLLAELGRLAMLTHAFRQIDTLPAGLQDDVRQMIGWTRKEDEVLARGAARRRRLDRAGRTRDHRRPPARQPHLAARRDDGPRRACDPVCAAWRRLCGNFCRRHTPAGNPRLLARRFSAARPCARPHRTTSAARHPPPRRPGHRRFSRGCRAVPCPSALAGSVPLRPPGRGSGADRRPLARSGWFGDNPAARAWNPLDTAGTRGRRFRRSGRRVGWPESASAWRDGRWSLPSAAGG